MIKLIRIMLCFSIITDIAVICRGDELPDIKISKGNLIINSSFEDSKDGMLPDGWHFPKNMCFWENDTAHSGKHSLKFSNKDESVYKTISQAINVKPGMSYHFSAWIKGKENNGGAGICVEWLDKDGKYINGRYPVPLTGQFDWTLLQSTTPELPSNAKSCQVTLLLQKGSVGTVWFDDVSLAEIQPTPAQISLVCPFFRGEISAPSKGKYIKVRIMTEARTSMFNRGFMVEASLQNTITNKVYILDGRKMPGTERIYNISWCLPDLPLGLHELDIKLIDADGRTLLAQKENIRVISPSGYSKKVTVDEHRRLIVDGKPFYPVGIYLAEATQEDMERISKAGFNTILSYRYGYESDATRYMNCAQKNNLKVIYSIKDLYDGALWFPKRGKTSVQLTREYVNRFRDHPALLAWNTNDEFGPEWMPKLSLMYQLVSELDPNHPVYMVHNAPGEYPCYYPVTDIFATDPYPVPSRPLTEVSEWVEWAIKAMKNNKPVWAVLQLHDQGYYDKVSGGREPSYEEQRCMTYLAIVHGAQGILYYSYFDLLHSSGIKEIGQFEERWGQICRIVKEIEELTPVLLEGKDLKIDFSTTAVHYRVLQFDSKLYLIAVNPSTKESVNFNVTLGRMDKVKCLFDDSIIEAKENKFDDLLKPLSAKVYLIEQEEKSLKGED